MWRSCPGKGIILGKPGTLVKGCTWLDGSTIVKEPGTRCPSLTFPLPSLLPSLSIEQGQSEAVWARWCSYCLGKESRVERAVGRWKLPSVTAAQWLQGRDRCGTHPHWSRGNQLYLLGKRCCRMSLWGLILQVVYILHKKVTRELNSLKNAYILKNMKNYKSKYERASWMIKI